jgi:formate-dependent nitrite reductase membrane component NrfD
MQLQMNWGWLVALYLFLGGLGAGAFCTVAPISLVTGERFKSTVRFGAWVSTGAIALGALVLLLDVGKPLRALILFRSFVNFNSWMTIGAWLLFGAILLNGLYALLWTDGALAWLGRLWKPLEEKRSTWRIILAIIGIPLGLGVAGYTGMLVEVLQFRPFWNTWLLPVLFTASALSTGGVLVVAYLILRERAQGAERLVKTIGLFHIALILIEGTIWVTYLRTMLSGSPDAARAAQVLVSGALSPIFWIVVIGLGLALPFLVHLNQLTRLVKHGTPALIIHLAGICSVLIAGLALRFVVLSAGLPASLSSPALMQILAGIRFIP